VIFSVPTNPGDDPSLMHHSSEGEDGIEDAFAMIDTFDPMGVEDGAALTPGMYLLTGTFPLKKVECRRLTREEGADLVGSDDPNNPIRFPWTPKE
jgi:hypothetical protein